MQRLFILVVTACSFFVSSFSSPSSFSQRRILAWTSPKSSKASAEQLNNASWKGVYTGFMGFCGGAFNQTDGTIIVNETRYHGCDEIRLAAAALEGVEFHMVIGTVPNAALKNPNTTIDSAVQLALQHGWSGYNIDDESHTAPFGTIEEAHVWVSFINAFADGLHEHGLQLTADVQSVTLPWKYEPSPELTKLLTDSTIDRWINMDTYYFSTGRFLDALDYYSGVAMPSAKCGVGMMNRNDITYDGYQARFHAIEKSGVLELDMFAMPISDSFLPYLLKFKTGCSGCTNEGVLSCWSDLTCH